MKILYVAGRWDPLDHNQGSGTDYNLYNSLVQHGANVKIVGPFNYGYSFIERVLEKIHRIVFRKKLWKYSFSYIYKSGRQVNKAIRKFDPDIIVSFFAAPLVYNRSNKPILYITDASVKWMRDRWGDFSRLAYSILSVWEKIVIPKCDLILTFSEANAKVIREEYNLDTEKVRVFAIPAAIPEEYIPSKTNLEKKLETVKLLLVGRKFHRKGVDVAIDIANKLNEQGIPAVLRIVGIDGDDTETVKYMGLYNKTVPTELQGYIENYKWANFLLHPARFEAAGIVPGEAAAFGVPTLTNNAGGLATTVKHGVSGVVFPIDSSPEVYVNKIKEYINNIESYNRLVETTKERYDRELNWEFAGGLVYEAVREILRS